jgi:beta-lactamase superfamily II metal-dependent hydrolase
MARLTFKDVGQGDSVILEWTDNDEQHVGIFDCNRKGKTNPVLEHIIAKGYQRIDFIILSHPHEDHYSGFTELLEHCSAHSIKIGWFGNTSFNLNKKYWAQFETGHDATQELEKMLQLISKLLKEGTLEDIAPLLQGVTLELSEHLTLKVLSPGHHEMQQYQEKVDSDAGANKKEASQAANLLSTVFLITSGQNRALVTADAVAVTFERIHRQALLPAVPLALVQAPHHGSKKNYSATFWGGLLNAEGRRAVVSSGVNDKYRHPHLDVLTELDGLGFAIHATNIIYGMQEFLTLKQKTIVLDMASDLIDKDGGDKEFDL